MSLLGVDIGTTGAKAVVFDLAGNALATAYREYPLIHPNPGWIELDSETVWCLAKEAICEAVAEAGDSDPITAISFSVQGEAVTPLDKDGKALANAIVTFDNRTLPQSDWWAGTLGKERLFALTGQPLHPMYTINKIMWWRDNAPEVFAAAKHFLCFGDLALYRLGVEPLIDFSMASRTMAFDLKRKQWSAEILGMAQVSPDRLATPVPAGTVAGTISAEAAKELGLPANVKLVVGGHDQPCGALGSGILTGGEAVDATGTVECIAAAADEPVLTPAMLAGNHPCYHHVVADKYISLAFNFTGGSLLRWYRDVLGSQEMEEADTSGLDFYEILIGKAAGSPSPLLLLPHFTVTGTPWFDSHSKGALVGLSLATSKADIIKAMLEGITYEMRLNLDSLGQAGLPVSSIRAIGGGAKSSTWMQLKANIFNRPVSSLSVSEAACLGAALLAGSGTGQYASLAEAVAQTIKVTETVEPEPAEAAQYEERYQLYRDLYPTLKDYLHRL